MLETIGVPRNGILVFPKPEDVKRTDWLIRYSGKFVKEQLRVISKMRSPQQIKCHFGLLINTVIAKANDEGIDTSAFLKLLVRDDLPSGVGLTSDFLHELFYLVCPIFNEEGHRTTLSKMTVDEASRWFEECRNLLASRGIYVDDPDKNWKTKVIPEPGQ